MFVKNEIINLIKSKTQLADDITETTHLYKDLHFDSLTYIRFLMELENRFDIKIELAEMDNCLGIGQMIELIEKRTGRL